jgi:hypothetical protein
MISNIGTIRSAIKGLRRVQQNHGSIAGARRNLAIQKKRDGEKEARKRKILAYRNQQKS